MTGRRLARAAALAVGFLLIVAAIGQLVSAQEPGERPGDLTGQLLVATPEMADPRFARTVIYVIRHDATGAMGLVVNRPMGEIPLSRVLEELGIQGEEAKGSVRIHYGGPVERTAGFVLHTADYRGRNTLLINAGVALSSEPEIFRAMAAGRGPQRSRFILGYSGWGPDQLEVEMRAGAWVAVPADEALMFDDDYEGKWQRAYDRRMIKL